MTIGKRKGYASKGAGASPDNAPASNKAGGSLSRSDHYYLTRAFGPFSPGTTTIGASSEPQGHTATGGTINDYVEGSDVYRAHVFAGSGTFVISSLSAVYPAHVEYLVVAGGGGGAGWSGQNAGGAGGAGGFRTNVPGPPLAAPATAFPVSATTYPITVGGGGSAGVTNPGVSGTNSNFGPITSDGGGWGGYAGGAPGGGNSGGSGGSGAAPSSNVHDGNAPPKSPPQGNPSGHSNSNSSRASGGGGGAGGAGENATGSFPGGTAGNGGLAAVCNIAGADNVNFGTPGPTPGRWFAGGGGGAGCDEVFADLKLGIGGRGPDRTPTTSPIPTPYGGGGNGAPGGAPGAYKPDGWAATGGGGGGGRAPGAYGGAGGSGIVACRYKIGSVAPTVAASGGNISRYNSPSPGGDKWVHTFTASGTFTIPSGSISNAQILVVAGGGGGGTRHGGGGGGGGVIHVPTANTLSFGTYNVIVGAGGDSTVGGANANKGSDSSFGPPGSAAAPTHLLALGGGTGGAYPGSAGETGGGSGGGNSGEPGSGASGSQPAPTAYGSSTGYANDGGSGLASPQPATPDARLGGGGGGAGADGYDAGSHPFGATNGQGGAGVQIQIAGDPNNNYYWAGGGGGGAWGQAGGTPNGGHPNFHAGNGGVGGGGGGSSSQVSPDPGYEPWMDPSHDRPDGASGNGGGSALNSGLAGTQSGGGPDGYRNVGGAGGHNTGGGGGGNGQSNYSPWPQAATGGAGGSGIVIIAYPV